MPIAVIIHPHFFDTFDRQCHGGQYNVIFINRLIFGWIIRLINTFTLGIVPHV